MSHIHRIRSTARDLGMDGWLTTVEGRFTVANLLNYARCRDLGLPADLVPVADLNTVLERQGYRCAYCPYRIIHDFQLDHITPVSKGGGHVLSNIQFVCRLCNQSKRDNAQPLHPRDGSAWRLPDHTIPIPEGSW